MWTPAAPEQASNASSGSAARRSPHGSLVGSPADMVSPLDRDRPASAVGPTQLQGWHVRRDRIIEPEHALVAQQQDRRGRELLVIDAIRNMDRCRAAGSPVAERSLSRRVHERAVADDAPRHAGTGVGAHRTKRVVEGVQGVVEADMPPMMPSAARRRAGQADGRPPRCVARSSLDLSARAAGASSVSDSASTTASSPSDSSNSAGGFANVAAPVDPAASPRSRRSVADSASTVRP